MTAPWSRGFFITLNRNIFYIDLPVGIEHFPGSRRTSYYRSSPPPSQPWPQQKAALSPKTEIVSGSPNRTKLLRKIPWITTPRFGFSKTNRGTTKIKIASRIKMLAADKNKKHRPRKRLRIRLIDVVKRHAGIKQAKTPSGSAAAKSFR